MRARSKTPRAEGAAMPLMAHLRELRSRIFKSLAAIAIGAVIGWIYYKPIFAFLTAPVRAVVDDAQANGLDIRLVLTSVASPFVLQLKVSSMAGIVLAAPVWIYQTWAFITPGLHKHERRYALGFVAAALPLFLGGVLVAMWVLPKGMELLFGFTPEDVGNYLSVDTYLSFLIRTVLVFGLGFLVPIFIVALNLVGILSAQAIRRTWRWTVLGVFLFGAIATPTGDPLSMMLLAGPMLLLILAAFGICLLNDRRRERKRHELGYDDLSDDEAAPIEAPTAIDAPSDDDLR
jgi:sec-independent protein translocase protein TatC